MSEKNQLLTMSLYKRFTQLLNKDTKFIKRIPDIRASGHCKSCMNRYEDVPVIDGIPMCDNCYKV